MDASTRGDAVPGGLPVDNADVLTQTWFVALLGSMVTVMVLLFAAILLVWRRQQQRKSSMLSNIYGECGGASARQRVSASATTDPASTRDFTALISASKVAPLWKTCG